jgi:hypothetical protein
VFFTVTFFHLSVYCTTLLSDTFPLYSVQIPWRIIFISNGPLDPLHFACNLTNVLDLLYVIILLDVSLFFSFIFWCILLVGKQIEIHNQISLLTRLLRFIWVILRFSGVILLEAFWFDITLSLYMDIDASKSTLTSYFIFESQQYHCDLSRLRRETLFQKLLEVCLFSKLDLEKTTSSISSRVVTIIPKSSWI